MARFRTALVAALLAGLMELAPLEAPPRRVWAPSAAIVLEIGEPVTALWARR